MQSLPEPSTVLHRQRLATIVAEMTSMRDLWQQDLQHVEALSSIAGEH